MRADMRTTFRIVDGKVLLNRIDLLTDGAESELTGEVDLARWPEQTYQIKSRIDFPRMREIFFARDTFSLYGKGGFEGSFHLFREVVNGRPRTGRELKGSLHQRPGGRQRLSLRQPARVGPLGAGEDGGHQRVRDLPGRRGPVRVPHGAARRARRSRQAPVRRAVREHVDLTAFTSFMDWKAFASPAAPRAATCSSGRPAALPSAGPKAPVRVAAPPGVELMTRGDSRRAHRRGGASRRRVGPVQQSHADRAGADRRRPGLCLRPRVDRHRAERGRHAGDVHRVRRAAPPTVSSRAFRSTSRAPTGRRAIGCSRAS